jgi:anti-sigma28 factor (negative regulator of flagellin synthesis)
MNDINGINGYQGPVPIRSHATSPVSPDNASGISSHRGSGDQVEISHIAKFLSMTSELPEVRYGKVASMRAALNQGAYDVEGRLDGAMDRLLDDYLE